MTTSPSNNPPREPQGRLMPQEALAPLPKTMGPRTAKAMNEIHGAMERIITGAEPQEKAFLAHYFNIYQRAYLTHYSGMEHDTNGLIASAYSRRAPVHPNLIPARENLRDQHFARYLDGVLLPQLDRQYHYAHGGALGVPGSVSPARDAMNRLREEINPPFYKAWARNFYDAGKGGARPGGIVGGLIGGAIAAFALPVSGLWKLFAVVMMAVGGAWAGNKISEYASADKSPVSPLGPSTTTGNKNGTAPDKDHAKAEERPNPLNPRQAAEARAELKKLNIDLKDASTGTPVVFNGPRSTGSTGTVLS